MAELIKCDRCGRLYTYNDYNKVRHVECDYGNVIATHEFDLCDECTEKLYKFLESEEDDER